MGLNFYLNGFVYEGLENIAETILSQIKDQITF